MSDLKSPLTKGDYLISQFELKKQFCLAFSSLFFFIGCANVGYFIYDLITRSKFFGVDNLIYSVLLFYFAIKIHKEYYRFREEQERIQKILSNHGKRKSNGI